MNIHFSSKTPEWSTPQDFFDDLNREFSFTIDVCATKENAKCKRFFTKDCGINGNGGLDWSWGSETVWCNPPYGREIGKWVRKGFEATHLEETTHFGAVVVMLLPARTDTKWFHNYIYGKAEIRFIKGRLKFGGCKNSAPFPSMIVVFRCPKERYK